MTNHAQSAGPRTRLMALAGKAIAFVYPLSVKASYTPAMLASPWHKPDGNEPPDLTLRAHRLHNRDPKAAAIYLRKHQILDRGRCSDAD
jgi:hypothetical protein